MSGDAPPSGSRVREPHRSGFRAGVSCGLRGIGRCIVTPSLWPWALVPALLTVFLFGATIVSLHEGLDAWIREKVASWFGEGWAPWLAGFGSVVFALAALVVVYLVFAPVARVVAAPFLAVLSDRTMRRVVGAEPPALAGGPAVRFVLRPIGDALVFLVVRLVVTLPALLLHCIPFVGSILFFLVLVPLEGLDRMDVAQSSRGVTTNDRLAFLRRHFGACCGLGLVAAVLLIVPVVNVLMLPGLVVGAVLLDAEVSDDFPARSGAAA